MRAANPSTRNRTSSGVSSGRARGGGAGGRQREGEDAEGIGQILAERLLADGPEQVAIGGGDDSDVDRDRRAAADALDLALLEDAEQLCLGLQRQLADLVEEERAAV